MESINISSEFIFGAIISLFIVAGIYNLFPQRGSGVFNSNESSGIGMGIFLIIVALVGLIIYSSSQQLLHGDLPLGIKKMHIQSDTQNDDDDKFSYRKGGDMFIETGEDELPKIDATNQFDDDNELNFKELTDSIGQIIGDNDRQDTQSEAIKPNSHPTPQNEYYVQRAAAPSYERGVGRKSKEEILFPGRVHLAEIASEISLPFKILIGPFSDKKAAKEFVNNPEAYVRNRDKDQLILLTLKNR